MFSIKKNFISGMFALFFVSFFFLSSVSAATDYHYNEDVTAYCGDGLTHSGKYPEVGDVAVHQSSYKGDPVYPFGTMIYLTNGETISHPQYGELNSFRVEDTGDVDNTWSQNWFDVYWGSDTASCRNSAYDFGTKTYDYKAVY